MPDARRDVSGTPDVGPGGRAAACCAAPTRRPSEAEATLAEGEVMHRKDHGPRGVHAAQLAAWTAFALLAACTTAAWAQQGGPLLEKHAKGGVNCARCHAEVPPSAPVATAACTACHGDAAALAKRTARAIPNPHASPHLTASDPLRCESCHHVHRPSQNACVACHQEFAFSVP